MNTATVNTAWLDRIQIVGGDLALDFVNTVHTRRDPGVHDYLETPGHLLGWCLHQQLVESGDARRLARMSDVRGRHLLKAARRLRHTLDDILQARLERRPADDTLAHFNRTLESLARWRTLAPAASGFDWRHEVSPAHPESLLAPVAFAAAALLVSPELSRLKACPLETCGWLFLDRSRNASRTWCSMKTCGNVAKQRRHRTRRADVEGAHH